MVLVRKYAILLALLFAGVLVASAQPLSNSFASTSAISSSQIVQEFDSKGIVVRYQHDKAWPKWDYADNRTAYAELMKVVESLAADSTAVKVIFVEGAASPVGSDKYNKTLSERRARILTELMQSWKGGDKINFVTTSKGEDWETFAAYVCEKYHYSNRQAVLDIVESNRPNAEKERKLIALDRGKTWKVLVRNFMAPARNAVVVHIIQQGPLAKDIANLPAVNAGLRTSVEPTLQFHPTTVDTLPATPAYTSSVLSQLRERLAVAEADRIPLVALRSNLLVPALNVGVEVPIGNRLSVGADYYYPWVWPKADNKDCFELLSWGLEGRYWFGEERTATDRLQGHSVGLYGSVGYYDFERNFHGHQGEFVNVGVDYTYAMPIGKSKAMHLEFSLGVGYIYSEARKYTVIEPGAPLISDKITKKISFVGPTKANVSLVVPLFKSYLKPLNGNE